MLPRTPQNLTLKLTLGMVVAAVLFGKQMRMHVGDPLAALAGVVEEIHGIDDQRVQGFPEEFGIVSLELGGGAEAKPLDHSGFLEFLHQRRHFE